MRIGSAQQVGDVFVSLCELFCVQQINFAKVGEFYFCIFCVQKNAPQHNFCKDYRRLHIFWSKQVFKKFQKWFKSDPHQISKNGNCLHGVRPELVKEQSDLSQHGAARREEEAEDDQEFWVRSDYTLRSREWFGFVMLTQILEPFSRP